MTRVWAIAALFPLILGCGRGTLDLAAPELSAATASPFDASAAAPGPAPQSGGDAPDSGPDFPAPTAPGSTAAPSATAPVVLPPAQSPFTDAGQFCFGRDDCPPRRFCDQGRCIQCNDDDHCDPGTICDFPSGNCVVGCRRSTDCGRNEECDVTMGRCVECVSPFHCDRLYGGARSLCVNFQCQPCSDSTPCWFGAECVEGRCIGTAEAPDPSRPPEEGPPPEGDAPMAYPSEPFPPAPQEPPLGVAPDSGVGGSSSVPDASLMPTPASATLVDGG